MTRLGPTLVALALLAGSAAAFGVTERLKLEPTPITGTRVDEILSPVCRCPKRSATISFRVRGRRTVRVELLAGDEIVRTLAAGRRAAAGRVELEWDGRDDSGRIVPDGVYRARVALEDEARGILLPNRIRVDTVRPRITLLRLRPRLLSPNGDGRREYAEAFYRVSERADALLFVDGRKWLDSRFRPLEGKLVWFGRVRRRPLPAGVYRIQLGARDPAGNLAVRTPPVAVRILSGERTG